MKNALISCMLAGMLIARPEIATADNLALPDAITQHYGKFILEESGWLQADPIDPDRLTRIFSICLDRPGLANGKFVRFLAMCGNPFTKESGSHVDTGLVDLYVLDVSGALLAMEKGFAAGSWGVAGKVALFQIGQTAHAFLIDGDYAGMGESRTWQTIVAPTGGKLVELGTLPTSYSSLGLSFCDPDIREEVLADYRENGITVDENCYDVQYEIQFRKIDASSYFSINISESGQINGMSTNRSFDIPFDEQTKQYVVPAEIAHDM